jgi:NADH:ubiquinone oxidoreductase subunit 6 (chain J)
MFFTTLFFGGIALAIVGTGMGVLLTRNAIYTALFLVANFSLVAVLYLVLGAPFLAMAQVTVYAGAIMVLFLFVIMLLGAERLPGREPLKSQRPLALVLGGILLAQVALFVVWGFNNANPLQEAAPDFATPTQVATLLFTKYALPFEATSVILLVAMVGVIVLTRGEITSIRGRLLGKKKEE